MPLHKILSDKWDRRLYNWLLWMGPDGAGNQQHSEGVSSAYSLDEFGEGRGSGYRECGKAVLSGEARDTDTLMSKLRWNPQFGERIYQALVQWTKDDGTRGAQAKRLSTQEETYKDWVDSGKRELERLTRAKSGRQIKRTNLLPERV